MAPERIKKSISGPRPKKVVHHWFKGNVNNCCLELGIIIEESIFRGGLLERNDLFQFLSFSLQFCSWVCPLCHSSYKTNIWQSYPWTDFRS